MAYRKVTDDPEGLARVLKKLQEEMSLRELSGILRMDPKTLRRYGTWNGKK